MDFHFGKTPIPRSDDPSLSKAYPRRDPVVKRAGIHHAKGKLVATGTNGVLKNGASPGKAPKDVPPADYVKIDDEVTWLPAAIQFPTVRVFDRLALNKLSPQPDPPGKTH